MAELPTREFNPEQLPKTAIEERARNMEISFRREDIPLSYQTKFRPTYVMLRKTKRSVLQKV